MVHELHQILISSHTALLFVILFLCIFMLGKAANILVEQAVQLSRKWGLPQVVIGATIISLGTTLPEVIVSVMAAIHGSPGIALGNAVGSIICDTGLILGIASLLGALPIERTIVNRQGWIQVFAVFLLVILCLPLQNWQQVFTLGGNFPQWAGFLCLALLVLYIFLQIRWSQDAPEEKQVEGKEVSVLKRLSFLFAAFVVLAISSDCLIMTATEIAQRWQIPESIIAVTLVAFGTSLPELVTAITAVRRGHGGIAMGNVIGADILNVFLVAGAAAAVTPGGLNAGPEFFIRSFPFLIVIILAFRMGISLSKDVLQKKFGILLLLIYLAMTATNLIYQ